MQDNQSGSQPEIDLFYFVRPITNFIKRAGDILRSYFQSFWRNRLIASVIILFFIIAGVLVWFLVPKSYKTEAIYVSHIVPSWVCAELLEDLNSKSLKLGQELKISEPAASSIRDIESVALGSFYLRRSYDTLLYYNNGDSALNGVKITLKLKDLQYLDTIQHALVLYLSNSPYGKKRNEARREALITLRTSLMAKTRSLDSVQQIVNESILPRKEYSTGDPINPVDVYDASFYYNKQIVGINQELSIMDDVEVLYPFIHYSSANYPKLFAILLIAFGAGILMALCMAPWLGKKPELS